MNKLRQKDFYNHLTLYLDGQLNEKQRKEFEQYLEEHPEEKEEVHAFQKQKELLGTKAPIRANEWFWVNLSAKIMENTRQQMEHQRRFRRRLPAIVSFAAVLVTALTVVFYQQWDIVERFVSSRTVQFEEAYNKSLIKGNVIPLFTRLSADQVLQFVLYGTLPLDSTSQTALRVDTTSGKGYKIEFAHTQTKKRPPVSVDLFCSEVGVTAHQRKIVDSLLDDARRDLETSVLVADDNSLAIRSELPQYNQTVMANLAAALEMEQQAKFRKLLERTRAPYVFEARQATSHPVVRSLVRVTEPPRSNRFFIITPETVAISHIELNLDSMRMTAEMIMEQRARNAERRAQELIRVYSSKEEHYRRIPPLPFRVISEPDNFAIQVGEPVMPAPEQHVNIRIFRFAPPVPSQWERQAGSEMEVRIEAGKQIHVRVQKEGQKNESKQIMKKNGLPLFDGRKIDLDSLNQPPPEREMRTPPPKKKEYLEPIEL